MGLNNDDLISRAAALNAIDCWHIDFHTIDGAKVQTTCWRTIKELPAVDAAPVVHARWDEIRDYTQAGLISFECSECGRLCDTLYKYCPRCGARMDGEADER